MGGSILVLLIFRIKFRFENFEAGPKWQLLNLNFILIFEKIEENVAVAKMRMAKISIIQFWKFGYSKDRFHFIIDYNEYKKYSCYHIDKNIAVKI